MPGKLMICTKVMIKSHNTLTFRVAVTKEPQKHYSYISATQFPGMCYFNIKGLSGSQFEVFIGFKDF